MRQARNQLWRHYLIEFWNGCKALWAIARSSPSTLIAPLLLFAVLVAVGVWAVHFSAVQAARSFQEEAESVARNAAAQYRRALIDAFLPVDVLASHIRRAPDYESVSHLFNGSAALLFETVPSQALISLQLLPAGVLRMAYPPPLQQPVRVSPPLGADMFAAPHEGLQGMGIRSLADGHISIDGPMEHVPGLRALIVRQAVFVDVSHPGETFGRPDVPNPACGALCAFQPYDKSSSSAAAEAEAEAEAAGRPTGRLFWGLVAAVIHVDPFAGETAAAAAPPPFALSSLSGTDALADLTDYEHIGAAAAALRTLSELGYRYQVLITGSNQTTTIATSAPPPPQPGGGAAVVEAPIDLPGTQWVLRVSPAAAGGGGWMPRWVGGAIAAVVVSAAIAAAMLFGLLVSRRRHALLLQALLPPNMLSSGLRSAHVVEKHMRPTSSLIPESPAELLTDLLAELLAGATPDLRQVVLLRSLLLRNADWYRPLGMGGQLLHNANLESDVAQALMRQLGTCVVDDGDGGGGADGRGGFRTLGGYGEYLSLGGDSSSFDNMSAVLQQLWQQRPAAGAATTATVAAAARRHSSTAYAANATYANPNDSQGSNGMAGDGGDTGDSSSGYFHDLSNATPTTRQMLLMRREREAAATEKCRTLRGALSIIMAQDLSDSNKSLPDATGAAAAAATAAGDTAAMDAESQRGSFEDAGGTGSRGGGKGGGGWAAAAAAALAAAAAVPSSSRPSSPPSLPRPASLAALLHQWSMGASNGANGQVASRGASAAAVTAPPAAALAAAPACDTEQQARASTARRSSMPYGTAASPLVPGLLASLARQRSSAVSSYNHMLLQQQQHSASVAAFANTAAAGLAAGGSSPRPAAAVSLNVASAAALLTSTAPQSPVKRCGNSPLPLLPAPLSTLTATEPVPGGGAPAQAGSAAPATPAAATSTAGAISERAVLHHIGWGLRRSRRSNGPTSAPSLAAAAAVLGAPQAAAALDDDHVDACYLPPPPKLQSAARTEAAAAAAAAKAPRGSGGGGTAVRTDGGVTGTNNNNNYNNSGSQRVLVEDELKGQTGRKAPAAPPRAIPAAALQAIPSSEGGVEAAGGRSNDSPTRHRGVAMAAAGQVGAGGGGGAGAEEAVVDVARLLSGTKDSSRRRASAVAVSSGRYRASGSCNSCGSPVAPAVGGGALTAAGAALAAAAVTASGAHVRVREEPAGPALLPSASEALIVRAPMLDKVAMLLSQAEDLQYDTWALADATGGRPLSVLAFYLFQRQGLIKRFHIKPLKLIRLLRAIEAGYNADVPYHNATHAADVLRTTHVLAHAACLTAHHVDTVGLMALYFAAIIHDFRHPGLTGDFLVATSHPLALRYNDRSPLESHHAASAFTLMAEQPELDAFEVLSREQRAAFRKQVVELVMGTDMKQHFALLSQFTNAVSAQRLKQQHKQAAAAASATASPVDGCGGGGGGAVRAHGGVVGGLLGRKKGRTLSGVTSQSDGGDRTKSGPPSMFNAGKLSVQRASDPAPDVDSIETGEDRARRQGSFAAISEGAMAAMAPSPAAAASPRGPPQHQQTSRFARQSLPASRANAAVVMTGTAAAAAPLPAPPADEAQRLLALQICLKVADIGHLSGTLPVHKRWLGVLEEELFRQGDRERELGLPISPLFDRTKQGVSKSQVGFFEFVALPLVRALTSAFPGATPLISCFEFNYQYWKEQQQKQQLQEQRGQEQHLKE